MINVHPDYEISRGEGFSRYVQNDIATIHVTEKSEKEFEDKHLYPACLPKQKTNDLIGGYGIHAGLIEKIDV